jgi:hypothetical protein
MPRRTHIHKVIIMGSGPIVIGQACEFDYSGIQAYRNDHGFVKSLQTYHMEINPCSAGQGGSTQ